MASKPLTTEAIALTEKKMDMTLDDIIKMTKKPTNKEKIPPRRSIKSQGFLSGIAAQRTNRLQRVMDSKTSIRQGVLAQRRSNFGGDRFPLTASAARRAVVMPTHNTAINRNKPRLVSATARATTQRAANGIGAGKDTMAMPPKQRPQTLDALFAGMKENRMRVMSSQQQSLPDDDSQTTQRRRGRRQQQRRRGVRDGALPDRR